MSTRLFDHVDLRVSSIARARRLYDAFFPAVGFTKVRGREPGDDSDEPWASYTVEDDTHPKPPFIWLNEQPGHRGGANRVAFWADSPAAVDRVGAVLRGCGEVVRVLEGPEYCHDYTPGYYALFFEDEDGNKWEVCCRVADPR